MSPFFILSCARSGSTSLAKILDEATRGHCACEPMPNLNRETRLAMDGRLADTRAVVDELVVPRVRAGLREHGAYGEKNVTYGPFVADLHDALDARFVFLHRDGRDVVSSLIAWHEGLFGNVYRECCAPGRLAPAAVSTLAALPVWKDTSDFARPRPRPDEPIAERWESASRLEMCAYYWNRINALYGDALARLPRDAWTRLDYTRAGAEELMEVARFCGLEGLDRATVEARLAARINSLADRGAEVPQPRGWRDWDGGERRAFAALAAEGMERLGYWTDPATRWRPDGYGAWWADHDGGLEWYEWMYDTRRAMHEDCLAWITARRGAGDRIDSVADLGCGLGVGYAEALADSRYLGIDLERNVAWCRANTDNPRHAYAALDFIAEPLPERCDVVMSSGTIDNVYDVDALLAAMVRASAGWIYLTAYRGWFPELDEHRYSWSDEHKCFYTDVAPKRLRATLEALGCTAITIEPRRTHRTDIPYETRVTARVPGSGTRHSAPLEAEAVTT